MSEFSRVLVTMLDFKWSNSCLIRCSTLNDLTLNLDVHGNSYPHFISLSLHDCEMKLSNFRHALALWSR